jgi:branched-chain amino acid transport system permease protein
LVKLTVVIGLYVFVGNSGVFSFGHIAFMALGGYVSALLTILALGMERIAFRPLRRASPPTLLIASFAVSYFLQHIVLIVFGSRPMGVDFLSSLGESFEFAGLRVPLLQCIAIATTVILMVGLVFFFRKSRIGVQMRAAAEDFTMARLLGVKANRVIAVAFALSGILASFVSLYLVAQTGSVSYKMGVNMVLIAFVASVIGGMGSLTGAALGGFLVGIVSVSLQAYLPEELRPYRDAFVFLAFIAFLLWRPQGLLVRQASERV